MPDAVRIPGNDSSGFVTLSSLVIIIVFGIGRTIPESASFWYMYRRSFRVFFLIHSDSERRTSLFFDIIVGVVHPHHPGGILYNFLFVRLDIIWNHPLLFLQEITAPVLVVVSITVTSVL